MSLNVVAIVEGHGEQRAIRTLLTRIWNELLGGDYLNVLQPIRRPRGKLRIEQELQRAVALAAKKLPGLAEPHLILILFDADNECMTAETPLGPAVLEWAKVARSDADIAVVVANVEFETWFVAAAESLAEYLDLGGNPAPVDPESQRCGKGWVAERYRGRKYSETIDQPKLTAQMNLAVCRARSPSFDKLCRELESRFRQQQIGTS